MKLVWTKNNRRQTLKIHHWLFGRRRWIKHDFISRPEGREAKGMCFLKDWMLKNRCKQLNQEKKRRCKPIRFAAVWRRHPEACHTTNTLQPWGITVLPRLFPKHPAHLQITVNCPMKGSLQPGLRFCVKTNWIRYIKYRSNKYAVLFVIQDRCMVTKIGHFAPHLRISQE